jgi:RNA polymerase primary sigma factor
MKSNLDDLIQEGFFGLVKAAQKFDTRKGSSFDCVAFMWIRNEIQVALKRHYMASYEFDTINERLVLSLEHEQKTVWDLADVEHLVKLSEHEKSLLQLRFQGSMTLHEIAARNRCSHETARRHLNKVINKLRLAYLEEQCA